MKLATSIIATKYKTKSTRQAMYLQRNNQARSCKYCCSEKAIRITYSECVFVDLSIQHAMRMYHIAICGLPRSATFIHILSSTARI